MDFQDIESIKKLISVQPAKLMITPQGIALQIQRMTEMQAEICSMERQINGMRRKLAKQGQTIDRQNTDMQRMAQNYKLLERECNGLEAQLAAKHAPVHAELDKVRAERDGLQQRITELERQLAEARDKCDTWAESMDWACDGRFPVQIGTNLGEVVRRQFEAMQRRRDELSQRLADEQRRCITVSDLEGLTADALQRYCRVFRFGVGTPVRMRAADALRVFELAIQALDRPGELGETVGQLRRHAAQVQSTAERLTQLVSHKPQN